MRYSSRQSIIALFMAALMVAQPFAVYAQQAPQGTLIVPSVLGLPVEQAKSVMESIGLAPSFALGKAPPVGAKQLVVYEQHPRPGTAVTAGAAISLTIYAPGQQTANHQTSNVGVRELRVVQAVPFLDEQQVLIAQRSAKLVGTALDLIVDAGAVSLEVKRSLLLEPGEEGLLGTRWRLNWEKQVLAAPSVAVLDEGVGQTIFHAMRDGRTYRAADGQKLVFANQHAVCTKQDGSREFYGPDGRLLAIDRRNGNKLVLKYEGQTLVRVEGPFGTFLRFQHDQQGQLATIEGSNGAVVHYQLGSPTDAPVTDVPPLAVRYAYDDAGRLTAIEHPRSGKTTIAYDAQNRVVRRAWADGAKDEYAYDDSARTWKHTDPSGHVTTTFWQQDRLAAGVQDPLGYLTKMEYDAMGRTTRVAGPTGESIQFTYDYLGRVAQINDSVRGPTQFLYEGESHRASVQINSGGHVERQSFDAQGNLVAAQSGAATIGAQVEYDAHGLAKTMTRADGQQVAIEYDSQGRVSRLTDVAGGATQLQYDRLGNVIREIDPRGAVTARAYDEHGRLVQQTDPTGGVTRMEYDQRGLLIKTIDPRGGETQYTYDVRGRLVSETDPAGRVHKWIYTPDGRLASVESPGQGNQTYKYDGAGNTIGMVDALGGGVASVYDPKGRLLAVIDSGGGRRQFSYSAAGQLIEEITPSGAKRRYGYDEQGRRVRVIDDAGNVTRYVYNKQGRVGMVLPPSGPVRRLTYDEHGQVTQVKSGEQVVTRYGYDALGRRIKETDAAGLTITYQYDKAGNLIQQQDNLGAQSQVEYDLAGRPVSVVDATGAKSQSKYDQVGNRIAMTNPTGHETRFAYTPAGELAEVIAANGDRVRLEYGAQGRPTTVHLPGGGTQQVEYNPLGMPVRSTDAAGSTQVAKYDANGRVVELTDPNGQITKLSYDQAGRLVRKQFADDMAIDYTYDAQNRLTSLDDGKFPVRMTYDRRGNRTKIEYPTIKRTLVYEFDEADRMTAFVDSEGQRTTYRYDALDRLIAIETPGAGTFQLAYDIGGRVTSLTYPNGVRGIFQYDVTGRATKMAYVHAAQKVVAGWKHQHDADGNCVETVESGGPTQRFAYDPSGQLIEETLPDGQQVQYTYAPGGNQTIRQQGDVKIEAKYDQAGRLLSSGKRKFKYDANGNLIEQTGPSGTTRYQYNSQNQMVMVQMPDGKKIAYGYAPTGQRIWREDQTGRTWYVGDGMHVVAQLDQDLKAAETYVHGPGTDWPLAILGGSGARFLHADRQGSVRRVTDQDGNVAAQLDYDAFGRVVRREGDAHIPFQFTARSFDEATSLYYFRARYYDAHTGRFLTRDPAPGNPRIPLSLNPYCYAYNNPVNLTDPLGLAPNDAPRRIFRNGQWYQVFWRGHSDRGWSETGRPVLADAARRPDGNVARGLHDSSRRLQQTANRLTTRPGGTPTRGGWGGVLESHTSSGAGSPLVSMASDRRVAERFAGEAGEVLEIHVPESAVGAPGQPDSFGRHRVSQNTHAGGLEAEWVSRHEVPDEWIHRAHPGRRLGAPVRSMSSFAQPSRWQRARTMMEDMAEGFRRSRLGGWLGRARSGLGRLGRRLMGPAAILLTMTSIASAGENMANAATREALDQVLGTVATWGVGLALGGPFGILAGLAAGMLASQLAATAADRLVPPAKRPEKKPEPKKPETKKPPPRRTAGTKKPKPKPSALDDGFIPQTFGMDDMTHDDAMEYLGPAERLEERGLDYFRERAKRYSPESKKANNTPLADYRRRAGRIDRQLTEQERIRAQQIADYNRRVAQENARRAAAVQQWHADQQWRRQQALQNWSRVMQQYWQPQHHHHHHGPGGDDSAPTRQFNFR